MQDGLLIDQLRNAVIESAFVAPYELDRRYAIEKQEREIDYVLIPASDYAASTAVTDEQVKRWYDENKQNYMLPETVNLQYVELTREHAESGIEVTEPALKEYYEQVKDRFTTQEQRHGRHILVTVGDGVDDAAARKKAEELPRRRRPARISRSSRRRTRRTQARRSRAATWDWRRATCSWVRSAMRCSRWPPARSADP